MSVKCKSCGAPIVWGKTEQGKPMPLDPTVLTILTHEGKVAQGRISHRKGRKA